MGRLDPPQANQESATINPGNRYGIYRRPPQNFGGELLKPTKLKKTALHHATTVKSIFLTIEDITKTQTRVEMSTSLLTNLTLLKGMYKLFVDTSN